MKCSSNPQKAEKKQRRDWKGRGQVEECPPHMPASLQSSLDPFHNGALSLCFSGMHLGCDSGRSPPGKSTELCLGCYHGLVNVYTTSHGRLFPKLAGWPASTKRGSLSRLGSQLTFSLVEAPSKGENGTFMFQLQKPKAPPSVQSILLGK